MVALATANLDWPFENISDVTPNFRYNFLYEIGKPAFKKEEVREKLNSKIV